MLILKIEENLIFQLYKTNNKIKVLRFLKIYDEITKCMDEDVTLYLFYRDWFKVL